MSVMIPSARIKKPGRTVPFWREENRIDRLTLKKTIVPQGVETGSSRTIRVYILFVFNNLDGNPVFGVSLDQG
jgi:hypothetical protein